MMGTSQKWLAALGLVLAMLMTLAVACGDDDDDDGGDDGGDATPAETTSDNGDGEALEFEVSMTDNAFDPDNFTVAPSSEVTIHLTNDGAAIHNMRIAGTDGEYNTDDDGVSDPDTIRGGETAELTWTAPSEAGEVQFQCDFHPTDMMGTITIE